MGNRKGRKPTASVRLMRKRRGQIAAKKRLDVTTKYASTDFDNENHEFSTEAANETVSVEPETQIRRSESTKLNIEEDSVQSTANTEYAKAYIRQIRTSESTKTNIESNPVQSTPKTEHANANIRLPTAEIQTSSGSQDSEVLQKARNRTSIRLVRKRLGKISAKKPYGDAASKENSAAADDPHVVDDNIIDEPSPICLRVNDKWTADPEDRLPKYSAVNSSRQSFKQSKSHNYKRYLLPTAVPTQHFAFLVSEQKAQLGPRKSPATTTSLDSSAPKEPVIDPLSICRFCGASSKDCVAVSGNMPYLAHNKTTLVLNDTSVQLDFNDGSLPKTVCRDCDAKLQGFADFVKIVKAAQDTLINVSKERAEYADTRVEFEVATAEETVDTETDTLVIKTEYDSQHKESDDDKEEKEGIIDSLTIEETVFIKPTVIHKRKVDTSTATSEPKKLKTKHCDDSELKSDIIEVIDKEDCEGQSKVSDDVKPSELELAKSAIVLEMPDGTSQFQGHLSNR